MTLRPVRRRTLAAALAVPALGTAIFQNWPGGGLPAQLLYVATKLFTLVLPFFFLVWKKPKLPRLKPLALGAASGLAICAVLAAVLATPFGETVRSAAPAVSAKVAELGVAEHFLLFAAGVTLLHSGLEEFYWRGLVFGALQQHTSTANAHAIAGIGFALHHVAILGQFFPLGHALWLSAAVGAGGVIWSVLTARSGSLLPAWLSHALVDAALMAVGYQLLA